MTYYKKGGEQTEEKKLLEPFIYLTQKGPEKRHLMVKFWYAFNQWISCPQDKMKEIGKIINVLFDASILYDDVVDRSQLRRGQPTTHLIFGVPRTLTTTMHITFLALKKLFGFEKPELIDCFIDCNLSLFQGQGIEIYFRDNFICPTEEDYMNMSFGKSTRPMLLAIKFLQILSTNAQDFSMLADKLGRFIQVYNDYLSLKSHKYVSLKTFCGDITEGKCNFPTIHAMQSQPNDNELMDILKQRTTDIELKKRFLKILEDRGSFEYTRVVLNQLKKECFEEIEKLDNNPHLEQVLDEIMQNLDTEVYFDAVD